MPTHDINVNTSLADDSVTNAKLANMDEATIKGRRAGVGAGDPQDLGPDMVSEILDLAADPFVRTSNLPAPGIQDGDVLSIGLTFPDNGFKLTEEGGGANTLTIRVDEVLSTDRILNLQVSDGDKTVNVTGDAELEGTNTGDETTSTLGSKINGATEKTTPVDADMVGLMDSAASNILKKLSWANIKAGLWSAWGALINTGTSKATPVDADALAIMDSAATNATKKLTWANLKATLKTYFDTLYVLSANELVGVLGSTQSTTSTTLVDCTGLSVSVAANSTYQIEGFILFQSTSTTNGISISLNGPSSPTEFAAQVTTSRLAISSANNNMNAYDQTQNSTDVIAANTSQHAFINGTLVNGATAGDLIVRFASESGAQTVRIMAGSSIRLKKVA